MSVNHTHTIDTDCKDCDKPVSNQSNLSPTASTAAQTTSSQAESSSSAQKPAASIGAISPPEKVVPAITIEFCDRCRWAPRATWIQTELFLTFPTPTIRSITLIPLTTEETGGRFRVWLDLGDKVELIWDRKTEGGFPELKILKQKLRNFISPDMGLGHSDKAGSNRFGVVTLPSDRNGGKAEVTEEAK